MMRIHGERHIVRRSIHIETDYAEAREALKEDFAGLCGYCGKNSRYLPYNYEIDHFVPKTIAPERINDYQNLVFACRKCNRIKGSKWPTNDKTISNDGRIGFVDPAADEYDVHLSRDEQGRIVFNTDLGKNMYELLRFDIRRTELFWAIETLYSIQEVFEKLHREGKLRKEEMSFYISLNEILKDIQQSLAAQGE